MSEGERTRVGQKLVVVGCGAAKRDRKLETGTLTVKRYPAKDLYTSTYFEKKREYAETIGDQWMILSALHGLIPPTEKIKPYDVTVDDLDGDRLDRWAHQIGMTLIEWVAWENGEGRDVEEIVVLAGKKYLDPLRERDVFQAGIDVPVSYPLQQNDLGGIGEQMGWLKDRVTSHQHEQTVLTDGGRTVVERPEVDVESLDYQATETHECSIEGEVTRDYYDCPNCGFSIAEWMDCPDCDWYDEDAWRRTLETDGGRDE
jgi:hypothetical protein